MYDSAIYPGKRRCWSSCSTPGYGCIYQNQVTQRLGNVGEKMTTWKGTERTWREFWTNFFCNEAPPEIWLWTLDRHNMQDTYVPLLKPYKQKSHFVFFIAVCLVLQALRFTCEAPWYHTSCQTNKIPPYIGPVFCQAGILLQTTVSWLNNGNPVSLTNVFFLLSQHRCRMVCRVDKYGQVLGFWKEHQVRSS